MKRGDVFTHFFTLSEDVYSDFINAFHDRNPLHISRDFALSKGFKDKVMHGNILGGFLSYFVGECLPVKNVIIISENFVFKNPIYPNQTLLFQAKIKEFYQSVKVFDFTFSFLDPVEKTIFAKGELRICYV
jgi:3-hydroxybutyryl-CoA dehydratase